MIIKTFNWLLPKSEYTVRFGHIVQVWCNRECHLGPVLLHCLLFCFVKSGPFEGIESLSTALPDDPIAKLSSFLSAEKWSDTASVLSMLTADQLSAHF
jgi:hypothetical protein